MSLQAEQEQLIHQLLDSITMPKRHREPEDTKASLRHAKRWFLLNLALFVCLLVAAAFIFAPTNEKPSTTSNAEPAPSKPLTLTERAYLKGQLLGLSERPETMPTYEAEWVKKVSEHELLINKDRLAQLYDLDSEAKWHTLRRRFSRGV